MLPLPGRRADERAAVDGRRRGARPGRRAPCGWPSASGAGRAEEETATRRAEAPAAPAKPEPEKSELAKQDQADADRKSAGCMTCHTKTDSPSMHTATTVKLGCIDCHGGKVEVRAPEGASRRLARLRGGQAAGPRAAARTRDVWRDLGEPAARLHGDS